MKAPQFNLPDQDGKPHKLSDYKGKWVIVYFYPKDDTPGCTTEACGLRDSISDFEKHGVIILGISKDSVASHKKFAEKFHLNFPILSDTDKTVIKAFGAWGKKKFMGKEFDGVLRNTYVVNPQGELVKIYEKVSPQTHAAEILKDVSALQNME